jgi:hypothetical protein
MCRDRQITYVQAQKHQAQQIRHGDYSRILLGYSDRNIIASIEKQRNQTRAIVRCHLGDDQAEAWKESPSVSINRHYIQIQTQKARRLGEKIQQGIQERSALNLLAHAQSSKKKTRRQSPHDIFEKTVILSLIQYVQKGLGKN